MIRWICEQCNKRWIYPVDSCLYCNAKTNKQIGTRFRVVGSSTVTIPSPMHPIVPYSVLLLEDEHGNRFPKKTMMQYVIGDEYKEIKDPNGVSIVRVKYDIEYAVKKALSLIEFSVDSSVVILPELLIPRYAYLAINTNPLVLESVIKILLKQISKEKITVATKSDPGFDTLVAAKKSGILDVCSKHKINFIDLRDAKFTEGISDIVLGAELLINIPVMKVSKKTGYSGAIENCLCAVSDEHYKNIHKTGLAKGIASCYQRLPRQIIIADATKAMEEDGPYQGSLAHLNLILASKDGVALDKTFSKIAVLNLPDYIPILDKEDKIKTVGEELACVILPLKEPKKELPGDLVIQNNGACLGCSGLIQSLLPEAKKMKLKATILVGANHTTANADAIAIGDCACLAVKEKQLSAICVSGCPPTREDLIKLLDYPKVESNSKTKANIKLIKGDQMLDDKTALITGAAHGIGKAIALTYAKNNANVIICDIPVAEEAGTKLVEEIKSHGVKSDFYPCDVTNSDDVKKLVESVQKDYENIDILVNNAGITKDRTLKKMTDEEWNDVIDVNLNGVFRITRAFLPIINGSGRIINISSVVGLSGNFGQTNYAASKAGVIGFTKSLAKELGKYRITVNAIAPGFIESKMTDKIPELTKMMILKLVPLGKFGFAQDVANASLYLASDLASYVSGTVICVDGGLAL